MDNNLNRIRDDAFNKGMDEGESYYIKIGYITKDVMKALSAGLQGTPLVLRNPNQVYSEAIYMRINHEKPDDFNVSGRASKKQNK